MTTNKMNLKEFCERLKADGAYISEDWHIMRSDGRPLSRQCRNGYYMVRKMYDHITYHFMEHRVIWQMCVGDIPDDYQVNHKDFNRANNNISNLELMTAKENIWYTKDAGRAKYAKGAASGKAIFTEEEVQAIRWLKQNGWNSKEIARLFDVKWEQTIQRVVRKDRYGEVADAADVIAIYPAIVKRTWREDIPKEQRIDNALMGMVGEIGELVDLYKKEMFQGHEPDDIAKIREVGDILYYLTAYGIEMGWDMSEVMYTNAQKLYDRYPNGFDVEHSLHRKEGDI